MLNVVSDVRFKGIYFLLQTNMRLWCVPVGFNIGIQFPRSTESSIYKDLNTLEVCRLNQIECVDNGTNKKHQWSTSELQDLANRGGPLI